MEGGRREEGSEGRRKRQTVTITIFTLTVSILETPPSEVTWGVQDSCPRLFKSEAAAQHPHLLARPESPESVHMDLLRSARGARGTRSTLTAAGTSTKERAQVCKTG